MLNAKYLIHNTVSRGFSVLEVLISMFIFITVTMGAVLSFSGAVKNQKIAHQKQRDLENLRTSIELIAKTMRMSTEVGPTGTVKTIYMYNYSESRCASFKIDSDDKLKGAYDSSITEANADKCDDLSVANYNYDQITSVGISSDSKFSIVSTDSDTVGKATIMLKAGNDTMQTTVSFRDFEEVKPN